MTKGNKTSGSEKTPKSSKKTKSLTKTAEYAAKQARIAKRTRDFIIEAEKIGFKLADPSILDDLNKTIRTKSAMEAFQKKYSSANLQKHLKFEITKIRSGLDLSGKVISKPVLSKMSYRQVFGSDKGRATAVNTMLRYRRPVTTTQKDKDGNEEHIEETVHITSRAEAARIWSIMDDLGFKPSQLTVGQKIDNDFFKIKRGWRKNNIGQYIEFKRIPYSDSTISNIFDLSEFAFSQEELYNVYQKQKAQVKLSDVDDTILADASLSIDSSILLSLLFKYLPPSEVPDYYKNITNAFKSGSTTDRAVLNQMILNGDNPSEFVDYIVSTMKIAFEHSRV